MTERALMYRDGRDEAYAGDPHAQELILRHDWKTNSVGYPEIFIDGFHFFLSPHTVRETGYKAWCGSVGHLDTGMEMSFDQRADIQSCSDAKLQLWRMKEHMEDRIKARVKA